MLVFCLIPFRGRREASWFSLSIIPLMPNHVQCFQKGHGSVFDDGPPEHGYLPCSPLNDTNPVALCCYKGQTCYSNGFCGGAGSVSGRSGWYLAGCTDSQWGPGCPKFCGDQAMTDAVYNTTAKLWQCCGTDMSGNPTCSDPLQEYFSAPAPEDLVPTYIIASASSNLPAWEFASSTASMSPASATVSPTTNTNATRSATSNGLATASNAATNAPALPLGLSSNARAGIGVAAGTSSVLIGAAITWLVLRRRRQKRRLAVGFSGGREFPRMPVVELGDVQKPETERREFARLSVAELQNNEKPRAELEGHLKAVAELATDQEGMAKRKVANKTPVAELANDEKPVSLRRKPDGTPIAELESDEKPEETPLTQKPVQKSSMQRLAEKPLPPDPPQEEEQEQEGDEDENENEEVETPVLVSPIEERR